MKLEIVCAGVGGRGVLLASTVLIEAAIASGQKAVASDEYGMSQRGGSVVSLVKIGDCASPFIGRENAHILMAFEESEFYKTLFFLKEGGIAFVNTGKKILPGSVQDLLKKRKIVHHLVDADGIARNEGMIQSANMAMLGYLAFSNIPPFSEKQLKDTIRARVPEKFLSKNLAVFQKGFDEAGTGKVGW
ncbi:MAG TPA: 2-oxoacid:acceptor oxidoreductase family protein [Syntrophorhabdaceae bacterium]|nr:2-oxoacid:acceptor oxidoreductase family protein [Syntrophorhabdaceae bacterium]